MSLICYAIVLVGSLAIAIALIYGLVKFGLYKYQERLSLEMSGTMLRVRSFGAISLLPYTDSPYVYSIFKCQKGLDVMINDCVVCLSGFEDGEDVRLLPQCKHSFHGPCIDMWLHSHSNCPVCRSPVERRAAGYSEKEKYSREAVPHISISLLEN